VNELPAISIPGFGQSSETKMGGLVSPAVVNTRLRRVQFGVPPNWVGRRTTGIDRTKEKRTTATNSFGRYARNDPRAAGTASFFSTLHVLRLSQPNSDGYFLPVKQSMDAACHQPRFAPQGRLGLCSGWRRDGALLRTRSRSNGSGWKIFSGTRAKAGALKAAINGDSHFPVREAEN
jgi:hypothetical protein